MTVDWPGIPPDETARRLALRVATAEFHEGVARVQLTGAIEFYKSHNSAIPQDKIETLVKQLADEWREHHAYLNRARQDLQAEKDRRLQNKLPLEGLSEANISAERARLAEGIDLTAPTPLDDLIAQYPSLDAAHPPLADTEDDDEEALRSRRRR